MKKMLGNKKFNITNFCEYYPNCYYYANEAYPNKIRCIDFSTEELEKVICPNVIEENIKLKVEILDKKSLVYKSNISKYVNKKRNEKNENRKY